MTPLLFPFARLASVPASAWLAPFASAPSFGPSGVMQVLELQRHWSQLWTDSMQIIAMRFWLAPPWLVGSAWVRDEWVRMTAEKFAASGEVLMEVVGAVAGASATPWTGTAQRMLAPYSRRTSGNARRLRSRVVLGPLPLINEVVTGRIADRIAASPRAGAAPPGRLAARSPGAATAARRPRRKRRS